MKPLSLLAINFVVVINGYPNPLETTKADDIEDRASNNYRKTIFLLFCEQMTYGAQHLYKQIIFRLIECVPTDDDECLSSTRYWGSKKDCSYAKKYCDSWAKDAKRCCPQTCGSGLLTKFQCNNLKSKGTCIYPNNVINQCPNEGIKDQVIHK